MHDYGVVLRVRVHGRVQGVWFRGWTVEQASRLGLSGWVRNRVDGTVEALLRGPAEDVREMVRRCWTGPPAAAVTHVEETAETGPVEPGFRQWPTV